MIEEFNKYTSEYDICDERIRYKKEHSLRVSELMGEYATDLGFDEEEVVIAKEIGILHDIGRFDQVSMQDSFSDLNGFDHAEYGADLLFKDGMIENFKIDKSHYPIIEFAIREHNKFSLKPHEDARTMRLAKLIRDIDKIDILYLQGVEGEYDTKADDSEISLPVKEAILNCKQVLRSDVKTHNDSIAVQMAFAFDINYEISLEPMREYISALYNRVGHPEIFESIYKRVIEFIDESRNKNVRN